MRSGCRCGSFPVAGAGRKNDKTKHHIQQQQSPRKKSQKAISIAIYKYDRNHDRSNDGVRYDFFK